MATTWVPDTNFTGTDFWYRVSTATFTTGTEVAPNSPTHGFALNGATDIQVHIESTGAAFTAGALYAYLQNSITGVWARAPDLDLSVQALSAQGFAGFRIPKFGRIAFVPQGLAQPSKLYIWGR